jgi:exopolysaccharide production protein ExoQ
VKTASAAISAWTSGAEASGAGVRAPLQVFAGFFFAFRMCIIYSGFQSDPRTGTAVTLLLGVCLLACGVVYTLGDERFSLELVRGSSTCKWLLGYLALAGASLFWTGAASRAATAGYWTGMLVDVVTVVLLLKAPELDVRVDGLMRGFVWGSLAVAVVAWMAPVLDNSRIGDDEFLHPNNLGLAFALAFFLAQHLARREWLWNAAALVLVLSLLRTISKTSIAAFLVAETIYIVRDKQISRWAKVRIAAAAVLLVVVSAGFLEAYATSYASDGNSAETLTGRTTIWAASLLMALERPWLGHGIDSYRALIPAFGTLEPVHAHNELLQQFFDYGVVGIVVATGLYVSLYRVARRAAASPYGRLAMALALFAGIRGLADTTNIGLSLPLWLFAALALAMTASTETAMVEARR